MSITRDVIVIGAGQAGLACAYYLRRSRLDWLVLDAEDAPGGAWLHTWESLRLFSPARWCSLPGRLMGTDPDYYPHRDELLDYLRDYEQRYCAHIERGVWVEAVHRLNDGRFALTLADGRRMTTRALISATGTWRAPQLPAIPGAQTFVGQQLHSAQYRNPLHYAGQRVLVVGAGNSGAQLMAELSGLCRASWVTLQEPVFLSPEVDGRVLFDVASAKYRALEQGQAADSTTPQPQACAGAQQLKGLSQIVQIPTVREALLAGQLSLTLRPFGQMTPQGVIWPDGEHEDIDVIIWCTGFSAALSHLDALSLAVDGQHPRVDGTRALEMPGLWLVGYGDWTGYASATLVGVGRSAKATVEQIIAWCGQC